jgi:hypothetical protein
MKNSILRMEMQICDGYGKPQRVRRRFSASCEQENFPVPAMSRDGKRSIRNNGKVRLLSPWFWNSV